MRVSYSMRQLTYTRFRAGGCAKGRRSARETSPPRFRYCWAISYWNINHNAIGWRTPTVKSIAWFLDRHPIEVPLSNRFPLERARIAPRSGSTELPWQHEKNRFIMSDVLGYRSSGVHVGKKQYANVARPAWTNEKSCRFVFTSSNRYRQPPGSKSRIVRNAWHDHSLVIDPFEDEMNFIASLPVIVSNDIVIVMTNTWNRTR